MSQSELSERKGWISAASLAIPRQHLHESEVEAFLEFLFGDIAERPEELTVREAASVVRYLSLLELRGVPSDVAHRSNKEIEEYLAAEPKGGRRHSRLHGHV